MANVDENTQIALEVVAQTFKLSEQALLLILKKLTNLLADKEQDPRNYILDEKTKAGKQKIGELMKKHEKGAGVVALDENLTKQQLQDYQKEFKKLGVDFSVVKNGKDEHSFFFAAAQANVIEKALKNVVERKSAELENKEVKTDVKDQVKNMLNSLDNDEQKLMVQYTEVLNERLNNDFADKSSHTESNKFDEMKKNFTPEQIEKVTAVINQNVSSVSYSKEKKDGKIHVGDFRNILEDIKKERIKEKPKQQKTEFSMAGVKEIDKKIKAEQSQISKDKNQKQSISR
ncbi:DUF3801 domain-containing protein [Bacillus cytotoxicus]|uniref:DUF3801 domain-containing protein n=1 Tax=Bacillus cytotoxicus TaxID=580165 RepID=A0ACC6A8D3_9BACI|nr:DUF3801 domain-containing protein [Bacillus cytotoxicus]